MNKLIEQLVEQTFNDSNKTNDRTWSLVYVSELKSYWLKEKNWFFPEAMFASIGTEPFEVDNTYELPNLFHMHGSTKFYAKKNEEDNSLVLYFEINEIKNAA